MSVYEFSIYPCFSDLYENKILYQLYSALCVKYISQGSPIVFSYCTCFNLNQVNRNIEYLESESLIKTFEKDNHTILIVPNWVKQCTKDPNIYYSCLCGEWHE